MSTTIVDKKIDNGRYSFNTFFGGEARGKCVQLTFDFKKDYLQLTKKELKQFIKDAKKAFDNLD